SIARKSNLGDLPKISPFLFHFKTAKSLHPAFYRCIGYPVVSGRPSGAKPRFWKNTISSIPSHAQPAPSPHPQRRQLTAVVVIVIVAGQPIAKRIGFRAAALAANE